jgi:seryl-tRNA synthetase
VLDLKAIRADPEPVRAALARRRDGSEALLDRALELDARRRALLPEVEGLKARQNEASQAIAAAKKSGGDASEEIAAMQEVARRAKALREELDGVQAELDETLSLLPNPPLPDAPDEDTVLYERGEAGRSGKDHLELADRLIDMEAGAKVAGSRFAYLKGDLVMLELALVRWALELLRGKRFEPVIPPVLVRDEALYGTGFLPDTEQQIYRLADDALYLTGRARLRSPRCTRARSSSRCRCATRASRPASGARRGQPAAIRAGCSACTSSTRSRCSRSSRPRRPRTSTSGCSPTRRRS